LCLPLPLSSTPFTYTTLFRSLLRVDVPCDGQVLGAGEAHVEQAQFLVAGLCEGHPSHLGVLGLGLQPQASPLVADHVERALEQGDRKSTRLNSSHVSISYSFF